MNVYCVFRSIEFESDTLVCIYSSEELAIEECLYLNSGDLCEDTTYHYRVVEVQDSIWNPTR